MAILITLTERETRALIHATELLSEALRSQVELGDSAFETAGQKLASALERQEREAA
jgi:hypothetical protein